MSTEERPGADDPNDQEVNSLLRQSFQRESARSPGAPTQDCMEAETLAAWSDGALPREEARAVEAHAAGCARCQAMLAAFARSEPAVDVLIQPAAAADRTTSEVSVWRRWRIGWLAPVAATAAALAIWVATPSTPVSEERREAAAPSAPASSEPLSAASGPEVRDRVRSLPDSAPVDPMTVPPPERRSSAARVEPAPQAATPAPDAALQELARAVPPPAQATARELDGVGANVVLSSPQTTAIAPPREAAADATADAQAARADKRSQQVPTPAPPVSAASARGLSSSPARTDLTLASAGTYRWRMRRDAGTSTVDFSENGGRDWTAAVVPADALRSIVAGVAAGGRVCWLVGGQGVVLLATDGVSFRRVPFPEVVDLTFASAADARRATVRAVDGRTFTTADGGGTWVAARP